MRLYQHTVSPPGGVARARDDRMCESRVGVLAEWLQVTQHSRRPSNQTHTERALTISVTFELQPFRHPACHRYDSNDENLEWQRKLGTTTKYYITVVPVLNLP